jgi:hypothetical protein
VTMQKIADFGSTLFVLEEITAAVGDGLLYL